MPQVRQILDLAHAVYGGAPAFDPANVRRNVVIASTAYFESRTVVALVQQLNRMAPGLRVETRSLIGGFPARELESGEFDLAIAAYFENPPRSFRIRTVFKDRFVCVCSKTNAYLRTRRTTADFLGRKHLQIEVPPGVFAPVDRYLTLKKKRREISLRIGNFLTPPAILEGSDLLLTCPSHLAQSYAGMYPLAITELPFPLPGITTKMIWHERNHRDAFHTWLRDAVSQPSESH